MTTTDPLDAAPFGDAPFDAAIVGAGPAGLATAIALGLAGVRVLVLDRRRLPIDKPCGEGLMPTGLAILDQLGVLPHLDPSRARPFVGIRYLAGSHIAEGTFDRPGLGIERPALSAALAARAREIPGVDLRDRVRVHVPSMTRDADGWTLRVGRDAHPVRARLLIGADGLASRVRSVAGLERPPPPRARQRYGLRQRFAAVPWTDRVEVHWSPGVEAYVTPTGPHALQVAYLWDKGCAPTARPIGPALLARFPALAGRLHGREAGPPATTGPLRRRARAVVGERLALAGDAAGYMDALTGEGLSLAFEHAQAMGQLLPPRLAGDRLRPRDLGPIARAHRRITRNYRATTGLLLELGRRPARIEALVAGLARHPHLFDHMLAVNMGRAPLITMWRAWPLLGALTA